MLQFHKFHRLQLACGSRFPFERVIYKSAAASARFHHTVFPAQHPVRVRKRRGVFAEFTVSFHLCIVSFFQKNHSPPSPVGTKPHSNILYGKTGRKSRPCGKIYGFWKRFGEITAPALVCPPESTTSCPTSRRIPPSIEVRRSAEPRQRRIVA